MLSDLDSGSVDGDLIYKPGFSPKGRHRFSRHGLISVFPLLSFKPYDTRGDPTKLSIDHLDNGSSIAIIWFASKRVALGLLQGHPYTAVTVLYGTEFSQPR